MTEIYPPTRHQFEEFLPNHEMIRRFELLFRLVGEDLFDLIQGNTEQAQATANNAITKIEALKEENNVDLSILEAKTNQSIGMAETNQNDILELEFLMNAL